MQEKAMQVYEVQFVGYITVAANSSQEAADITVNSITTTGDSPTTEVEVIVSSVKPIIE